MAGGDIGMLTTFGAFAHERDQYFDNLMQSVHESFHAETMPHPVIASVRLRCRRRVWLIACLCVRSGHSAADDCVFTSAYRHLGLTPDGGLSYFLPRVVGVKKAMEIVLLGDRFDAAEALRIGLINRIVPANELAAQTRAVAALLTSGPAMAIRNGKRLINTSMARN